MKNITVIGAGTMGNGIAHVFAMHGYEVNLIDVSSQALERGVATIRKNLERMWAKGLIEEARVEQTLGNLRTGTSIAAGVSHADLIVEAATENQSLKLDIFRQIDDAAPEKAILATNTSSISITAIAAATKRPSDWDALYESGTFNEIGRSNPWVPNKQ